MDSFIILCIWMTRVGRNAAETMVDSWLRLRSAAANMICSPGTNNTAARSRAPSWNAMTLYRLLPSPSRMMEWLLRQLNPWNRRARVRVENAMVHALPGPPS